MSEWCVTETPDDPSLGVYWIGEARTALEALDAFAESEGFVPYSALVDPRNTSEEEAVGWLGQNEYGVWAIFTNTTVYAMPLGDPIVALCKRAAAGDQAARETLYDHHGIDDEDRAAILAHQTRASIGW